MSTIIPCQEFQVKDSGDRTSYNSGMVRDKQTNKIDYTLILDGPMAKRWAEHLTKGAIKYQKRNWMLANGQQEFNDARQSLMRHFMQYMNGETDEDHAAAIIFNINLMEYIRGIATGIKDVTIPVPKDNRNVM